MTKKIRQRAHPKRDLRIPGMECQACGCTDDHACAGGRSWVVPGVCSQCVAAAFYTFDALRLFFSRNASGGNHPERG